MLYLQLRGELWKLFGKKRTYIGFTIILLTQLVVTVVFKYTRASANMMRTLESNGYLAEQFLSGLTVATVMLFPIAYVLMPLYVALVGGDLVAKEAEDGTLRMILSRPISRIRLLLVKWIAGSIFAAVLVLSLGIIALGFARLYFAWKGMFVFAVIPSTFSLFTPDEGLALYAFSHLFMIMNAVTLLSVTFMFSCFNMKPAAATILALSFLFANMVIEHIPFFQQYRIWFLTYHLECWFWVFQQPAPWAQVLQSVIILLAISVTALGIGAVGFQIRDIKS